MKTAALRLALIAIGLAIFAVALFTTAWICDDAYFSFRAVDNFVHGYGLTWNPGERVQAFTNPLWVLLLIPFHFVYSEIYYTSLFFSMLLSLAAVYLILRRHAGSPIAVVLVVLLVTLSQAFLHFSTSGLENPLSHLLIVIFFTLYFVQEWNPRLLFYLVLVASLGMVNRLDTLLIYIPALLYVTWQLRSWTALRPVLLGATPIIAWELFSIVYYGFPFPNTYYAKLSTGISGGALRSQGVNYVIDAFSSHPLMMIALVAAVAIPIAVRNFRTVAAACGIVLYTLYVVNVGGDFMSGRFFTASYMVAIIILARHWIYRRVGVVVAILIIVVGLGFLWPMTSLTPGTKLNSATARAAQWHGITNEREWYAPETALISNLGKSQPNHHPQARLGRRMRTDTSKVLFAVNGMIGYFAGPKIISVGLDALSDPLLSRLPTVDRQEWRIGHFRRNFPLRYYETLLTGTNQLLDSNLAAYYDHLCTITRGDVFSSHRFSEIAKFNARKFDYLLHRYNTAPKLEVYYSDIKERKSPGTEWGANGNTVIAENGMTVLFDSTVHSRRLELSLDDDDAYEIVFSQSGRDIDSVVISAAPQADGGLRVSVLGLPVNLATGGFDRIRIHPVSGDGRYSVGHMYFQDPEI